MDKNSFRQGRIYIEPYNTRQWRYYVWVHGTIAGFLSIGRGELYPDGPELEIHWKGLKVMTGQDLEDLKEGIERLRKNHL